MFVTEPQTHVMYIQYAGALYDAARTYVECNRSTSHLVMVNEVTKRLYSDLGTRIIHRDERLFMISSHYEAFSSDFCCSNSGSDVAADSDEPGTDAENGELNDNNKTRGNNEKSGFSSPDQ